MLVQVFLNMASEGLRRQITEDRGWRTAFGSGRRTSG